MKLTQQRLEILKMLSRRNINHDACPTAYEIGYGLGRTRNAGDWAHGKLRDLHRAGLVKVVGVGPNNAATWAITDDGVEALTNY